MKFKIRYADQIVGILTIAAILARYSLVADTVASTFGSIQPGPK